MDFANERYVRLYTRETTTFRLLPWEGQALLTQVLRLVDRSGLLELEGVTAEEALMIALPKWPPEVVAAGLSALLARGVLELNDGAIVWPRFVEAQDTPASSAKRNRDWRSRRVGETESLAPETKRLADETKRTPEEIEETEEKRRARAETRAITNWFDSVFVAAFPEHRQGTQLKSARNFVTRTLRPDEQTRASIMRHLAAWKASHDWSKSGGEYVPGLMRFFDNRCHERMPAVNGNGAPKASRDRKADLEAALAQVLRQDPGFRGGIPDPHVTGVVIQNQDRELWREILREHAIGAAGVPA